MTHLIFAVLGSAMAGIIGAWLVWQYIYSIGARVVTDQMYNQLSDRVSLSGAIAGAIAGLAVALSLRRSPPQLTLGVLFGGHFIAVFGGTVGGSIGWQQGLWGYFGTLGAFVLSLMLRLFFRSSPPKHTPSHPQAS